MLFNVLLCAVFFGLVARLDGAEYGTVSSSTTQSPSPVPTRLPTIEPTDYPTSSEEYAKGIRCPSPCDSVPCVCRKRIDPGCLVCHDDPGHENGCSQCKEKFFKKDNDYKCASCNYVMLGRCEFCQDYNGCGQCKQDYERVYDDDCGLWKCMPKY